MLAFESQVKSMEENMTILRGELYKFYHDKEKKSSRSSRRCLSNISKIAKQMRKDIQVELKSRPIVKKNISPERLKVIAEKRKATVDAKKSKKRT